MCSTSKKKPSARIVDGTGGRGMLTVETIGRIRREFFVKGKGIKEIASGEIMLLEATDNGARSDIPAWATQTGNELVESEEADGVMKFYIRKK